MSDNAEPKLDDEDPGRGGSLVPLYSPLDVTRGIQAYRRGDIILYTVRGEPSKVQELIGELDRRGVSELVALVSHRVAGGDSLERSDSAVSGDRDNGAKPEVEPQPEQNE